MKMPTSFSEVPGRFLSNSCVSARDKDGLSSKTEGAAAPWPLHPLPESQYKNTLNKILTNK